MADDTDISTLNSLVKTTIDSVKGFEDAAEDSEGGRFATIFSEFAQERREVVAMLQQEVRRLGGTPEDDSSFLAAAHRTFMNLKQTVMSRDDKAIVDEVERGEDFIKAKYEAALKDQDVSAATRAIIEKAFVSVRAGHDRARALKHSMSNEV